MTLNIVKQQQSRLKNFGLRCEATREPDFEGEKTVYYTYNGRQEFPLALAPHEARQLVELLKHEFGL